MHLCSLYRLRPTKMGTSAQWWELYLKGYAQRSLRAYSLDGGRHVHAFIRQEKSRDRRLLFSSLIRTYDPLEVRVSVEFAWQVFMFSCNSVVPTTSSLLWSSLANIGWTLLCIFQDFQPPCSDYNGRIFRVLVKTKQVRKGTLCLSSANGGLQLDHPISASRHGERGGRWCYWNGVNDILVLCFCVLLSLKLEAWNISLVDAGILLGATAVVTPGSAGYLFEQCCILASL